MTKLKGIRAVYERSPEYVTAKELSRFTSAKDVYKWVKDLQDETKEHFLCIHLDSKNRAICIDVVSIGSLNASIVHPREVFKMALLSNAAAILFVHNHPSGIETPSREDIDLTSRLKDASDLLGIRLLDHLIVGESGYYSFADRGLLG